MIFRDRETDEERVPIDHIDVTLAINRQKIILQMIKDGQLDSEAGIELFQATLRPDQVKADREAFQEGYFEPNSPSGRLATLLSKLKGNKP